MKALSLSLGLVLVYKEITKSGENHVRISSRAYNLMGTVNSIEIWHCVTSYVM